MLSTLIFTNLFLLKTSTSPCLSKKCIFVLPFNVPSSKFENVSFSYNNYKKTIDSLSFEIKENEDTDNVYLIKDGTLFLLYGRKDFEKMTSRKYEYLKGLNGHFEIAMYVDTFDEVDQEYQKAVSKGAVSVLEPTTEPWGQRTCYISDPEGNLIEIGSFNKPFER